MTKKLPFTTEFEREAVRLARTNGRTRREIADDLGIGLSTLTQWLSRNRDAAVDDPGRREGDEDMAAELKRLRRENEVVDRRCPEDTATEAEACRSDAVCLVTMDSIERLSR